MTPSILIIEDDLTFATMLKNVVGKKGFEVDTAGSSSRAKKQLSARSYDHIVPTYGFLTKTEYICWHGLQPVALPFIIMTSYAEIQTAVQAIKQGASDYIAKPVQPWRIAEKDKRSPKSEVPATPSEAHIEKILRKVFLKVKVRSSSPIIQLCPSGCPNQMSVLINGASGTGKRIW